MNGELFPGKRWPTRRGHGGKFKDIIFRRAKIRDKMEKFACIPVLGPKVTYLQSGRYIKIVGAYYFFLLLSNFPKLFVRGLLFYYIGSCLRKMFWCCMYIFCISEYIIIKMISIYELLKYWIVLWVNLLLILSFDESYSVWIIKKAHCFFIVLFSSKIRGGENTRNSFVLEKYTKL